ncbi:hypothetical protein K474DRAFT_1683146 [Panus rudis PR-1116 ss-1]|nr:hypothetical protein K474DRAFT_1683146 [Panus rudis PR-1116 ss-1]
MGPSIIITSQPRAPTTCLPPLRTLSSCHASQVRHALQNLRHLYFADIAHSKPTISPVIPLRKLPNHSVHDNSVPDSGYASEDEDNDEEVPELSEEEVNILRADTFEREFAMRWLTGFTARSGMWVDGVDDESEQEIRASLVDEAASLLASFAGEGQEEPLARSFSFPTSNAGRSIHVELNDAPLLSEDHTSVGLQSWGSSIIFAERLCANPEKFKLGMSASRILELGAGTGLLSIAIGKLYSDALHPPTIVATDYHPSVLSNLRGNVRANFRSCPSAVDVFPFDWQYPRSDAPFHEPFDVILAADVIYQSEHARWIKTCVERLLRGVFWLIIPVRSTGRHAGMSDTVEQVFPFAPRELAILRKDNIGRLEGVGRADESGYVLFEIGWVQNSHA